MRRGPQPGFTLVELMIAISVLAAMLAAVSGAAATLGSAMETNSCSAEMVTIARRNVQRVAAFARPAKLSTFSVQAVQEDVTNGLATAVGQWISPTENVWRPSIQFQAASGLLSMNAALSTTPRRLVFLMETTETDNGVDDDGDGLIDEGTVELTHDAVTIAVVRDVEQCEFQFQGRMLGMRLQLAKRDSKHRVHRFFVEQDLYMRNN